MLAMEMRRMFVLHSAEEDIDGEDGKKKKKEGGGEKEAEG